MSFELLFFLTFAGGWLASRLFELVKLPGVMGMTIFGVALGTIIRYLGLSWPDGFWQIEPFIKSLALVIILLRAGLGISRKRLNKAGLPALLMAFIPCIFEGVVLLFALRWLFDFSFPVAGLTAFMIAAVSPAVVVPAMLDLQSRGMGQKNGVITVVLAGASVDDVLAISLFSVFLGLSVDPATSANVFQPLLMLPLVLGGGIILGLLAGFGLAHWFRRGHKQIRATEKAILLLASGIFLLQVGDFLHVAALLGVMTLGFILVERAELAAHELAEKLGKIWVAAQIALFVIIGLSLEVGVLSEVGLKALVALGLGLSARSLGVLLATWPSSLTFQERIFCVIAYLPKATVQAALGGVALAAGLPEGQAILGIAVLAIVVTAPAGLLGIRLGAQRLLTVDGLQ